MPLYGQVVVGPPGSGKTTYCDGVQQYLRLLGRDCRVINLDPANERAPPAPTAAAAAGQDDGGDGGAEVPPRGRDGTGDGCGEGDDAGGGGGDDADDAGRALPYDALLDVCEEVVNLSSVMESLDLGPNGGLMYCMEYVERHVDHVVQIIRERASPTSYLLLDLPGQVELYTHCECVRNVMARLVGELDLRLCAVQLIDAHYCADAAKFISAALLSTTTMLRLELPCVNVLSKIDLIGRYGGEAGLAYNLDFFAECRDLDRLVDFLDSDPSADADPDWDEYADDPEYAAARDRRRASAFFRRRRRLHERMCEVVDDFSLLSYVTLDISDAESVGRVVARVDKANGYVFLGGVGGPGAAVKEEDEVRDMFQCAIQADSERTYEQMADVQERFLGMFQESIPELERQKKKDQCEGGTGR